MSFYRKITRERTLCSFNDLHTTDEGLKESISRFSRKPRETKLYGTLKIKEDYYSKEGVNDKENCGNSASDSEDSDLDNRSYSWRIGCSRDSEDEKKWLKERKSYSKMLTSKIPIKWFRKRSKSNDSFLSEAKSSYVSDISKSSYVTDMSKSSYVTDMSYSYTRSEYNKERSDRMEDDDRDFRCERSRDRETIDTRYDMRSNKSRRGYDE
jgi:hypothetical protein